MSAVLHAEYVNCHYNHKRVVGTDMSSVSQPHQFIWQQFNEGICLDSTNITSATINSCNSDWPAVARRSNAYMGHDLQDAGVLKVCELKFFSLQAALNLDQHARDMSSSTNWQQTSNLCLHRVLCSL